MTLPCRPRPPAGVSTWALATWTVLASGLFVSSPGRAAESAKARGDVLRFAVSFVDQNCIDCHQPGTAKGDLTLDPAEANVPANDAEKWERVIRKLRPRQMPPLGEPRPEEAEYARMVAHLESLLDRSAAEKPNPGRTETFRRLTRLEYRNAIRDLLDLEVDVSALLPKDEISLGFDNVTVGELSPTLLESYLTAARKISQLAVGRPAAAPRTETMFIPPDQTQEDDTDGLPLGTRGGAEVPFYFPADAEYELQVRLTRHRYEEVEGLRRPHDLEILLDGRPVERFTVTPPAKGKKHDHVDRHLNVRVPVKAGSHRVGAAFLRNSSALLENESQPRLAHFNLDRHARTKPAVYSLTVVGPYDATGPGDTRSRRRVFATYPATPAEEEACAARIVSTLMRRAFRRPVDQKDLAAPLRFYAETRQREGFEAGIEMALRAVLMSPQFLFRIESEPAGAAPGTVYRIPDVELASRLSFFLWSSLPDDELLELAARGTLGQPQVLAAQTRRMLRDPRAGALVDSFAAQWLYLRNLDAVAPDGRLFVDFDHNLRQALRRETELLFESILREDRSVLDLLRADYTHLNERLAKHYGIPHVYGSQFRRVPLGPESRRGGVLTHGSILTVTSHANHTSPVNRGNWVLGNILGTPPKPPPPNVPQLEAAAATGKILSFREQIEKHRKSPACASCHNLMDPVGFAFENYDAIGRWRLDDGGVAIDASGNFPDGTAFTGAASLQQAILRRPELFVQTMVEKLLTYSLGRGVEHYDAPAIRAIVRAARPEDYRLSALVLGLVQSPPFQMRKTK